MIRIEIHGDGFSDITHITQEQYEDISWLMSITADTYHDIHKDIQDIRYKEEY